MLEDVVQTKPFEQAQAVMQRVVNLRMSRNGTRRFGVSMEDVCGYKSIKMSEVILEEF